MVSFKSLKTANELLDSYEENDDFFKNIMEDFCKKNYKKEPESLNDALTIALGEDFFEYVIDQLLFSRGGFVQIGCVEIFPELHEVGLTKYNYLYPLFCGFIKNYFAGLYKEGWDSYKTPRNDGYYLEEAILHINGSIELRRGEAPECVEDDFCYQESDYINALQLSLEKKIENANNNLENKKTALQQAQKEYEEALEEVQTLHDKRNSVIIDAVSKSHKSFDEIMSFLGASDADQ